VQSVEESATVDERLSYLHSITYPPRWELQRDLAQRYAKVSICQYYTVQLRYAVLIVQ
jgi:hypothetical protein